MSNTILTSYKFVADYLKENKVDALMVELPNNAMFAKIAKSEFVSVAELTPHVSVNLKTVKTHDFSADGISGHRHCINSCVTFLYVS